MTLPGSVLNFLHLPLFELAGLGCISRAAYFARHNRLQDDFSHFRLGTSPNRMLR
jgi:hypothetical protein